MNTHTKKQEQKQNKKSAAVVQGTSGSDAPLY